MTSYVLACGIWQAIEKSVNFLRISGTENLSDGEWIKLRYFCDRKKSWKLDALGRTRSGFRFFGDFITKSAGLTEATAYVTYGKKLVSSNWNKKTELELASWDGNPLPRLHPGRGHKTESACKQVGMMVLPLSPPHKKLDAWGHMASLHINRDTKQRLSFHHLFGPWPTFSVCV